MFSLLFSIAALASAGMSESGDEVLEIAAIDLNLGSGIEFDWS